MTAIRLAACLFVLSRSAALVADDSVADAEIRAAVDRGVSFLTDEGVGWKEGRKCASCHHAPSMIWALHEARNQGYSIDQEALREVTEWVLTPADPAKVLQQRKPENPEKNVSQCVLSLEFALQTARTEEPETTEARRKFWRELQIDQLDDGAWTLPPGSRATLPPIGGPKQIMTLQSLLALTPEEPKPADPDDPREAMRQRGLKWLAAESLADDLQSIALRLLLAHRLRAPAEEQQPLIAKLLERQNGDGGWSQAADIPCDSHATGQALYALLCSGLDRNSLAVRRAQAFLVKSQHKEGSWTVTPRGSGANLPSKNDGPISYVGTGWAVAALARSAPIGAAP
jgi:hypothetical protein